MPHSTYENLVIVAATLFRKQGYSASSISEILNDAHAAKGSLYHHFPGGKQDLAIAAARYSSECVLALMAECFDQARKKNESFSEGVQCFVEAIASMFETTEAQELSPVSATLLNGTADDEFRKEANAIFTAWQEAFLAEGVRFGMPVEDVRYRGKKLLLLMEGAWVVARAVGHAEPIRNVAQIMQEGDRVETPSIKLMEGAGTG